MLWRYIKAQLVVLLCGGLVGPIFLIVYFAIGQEPIVKWMFYVGLLITAADILIALALANFNAKSAAKTAALEQSGVLALAQITGMGETGTRINDQPLIKLQLRIEGPGVAPFDAQDRVIASVTRLGNLNNRKLVVLVDPTTREFRIDWERSALINGLVPATFTVAEDNRTYDLSGQTGALMEILQILKANGIGMNNMIDLRSNPAARQQVQAVVRRAATQQAPAGSAPAPPPSAPQYPSSPQYPGAPQYPSSPQYPGAPQYPSAPQYPDAAQYPSAPQEPSTSQRLQELETLRATGAISEDEYNTKRAQILSDL
jgi:hypothetical protein